MQPRDRLNHLNWWWRVGLGELQEIRIVQSATLDGDERVDESAGDAVVALGRRDEQPLHGRQPRLHLPPVQLGTVVGDGEPVGARRGQRISSSAIWMPLSAAPLRSWSPTTQKLSAFG